ncbi:MAG: DUF370 domain-containing protein [Peptococcaceae bacterium]|nr:DUF370 domain-containing protein [Peptococcaceae bacterium]
MFLHLGDDVMVLQKDIIAVIDIQTKVATSTRDFLKYARDERLVHAIVEEDKQRSFVITTDKIYLSPISCGTLRKRAGLKFTS